VYIEVEGLGPCLKSLYPTYLYALKANVQAAAQHRNKLLPKKSGFETTKKLDLKFAPF
jgi:hypothetical protein